MKRLERLKKKHAALLAKADELSTADDDRNDLLASAAILEIELDAAGPRSEPVCLTRKAPRGSDGRVFRFASFGLPEELTSWPNWVGWREGVPVPLALGRHSAYGLASPTAIWTWTDFHEALHTYRDRKMDGLAFMAEEPFLFVTLVGTVEGRTRPSVAARVVLEQARTYAEISPFDDITLVFETSTDVFDRLRGRGLRPLHFPETCGLRLYGGKVFSWHPLFHVPLTGLAVGAHPRVRWLHPELFEEVN